MENTEDTRVVDATVAPPTIDQAKIDAAKKKVDDFTAELKDKVYPVKIETEENFEALKNFILHEASWKNMEALGIIELNKQLEKQEVKNGNIYLRGLEIDAVNFFMSKVDGKGLESAKAHIALVTAGNGAMTLVKADNNMLNQLMVELEAAENGIEVEPTPTK
jgi:hypothetical protein